MGLNSDTDQEKIKEGIVENAEDMLEKETDDLDSGAVSSEMAVLCLKNIIDEYKKGIREIIYSDYSVRDSVTMYFGRGKAQRSDLHRKLYDNVEAEIKEIAGSLEACPDEELAYNAVYTVLNYAREDFDGLEDNMRLAFISIEALSIPLLPYVKNEKIKELKDAYIEKYPVKYMLPKQKELYDKLRQLSGENVKNRWKPADVFKDTHFAERHNIKVPKPFGQKNK